MNKVVVWKDGSYIFADITWEYENDSDWLTTIDLKKEDERREEESSQI